MKKAILLICLASIVSIAKSQVSAADICKNWAVQNVKVQGVGKDRQIKQADFILSSSGDYDIKFENTGEGVWRLEGTIIILFNIEKKKIEAVFKVLDKTP